MAHTIDTSKLNLYTDLAKELEVNSIKSKKYNGITVSSIFLDKNNVYDKKEGYYTTIEYEDVTDHKLSKLLEKRIVWELKKYIKRLNIKENDSCFVIGLGNENSTPDSLGTKTVSKILVTGHFFLNKLDVEKGYRNVCTLNPGVMGQTGIETYDTIKGIIDRIKPKFLIVVDSLKSYSKDRLNKTVQITDAGINPGSGIFNNRKEISKRSIGIPVIAIGIPTVISINSILSDFNINLNEDMIVTTKDIDFQIEKLSDILSNSINKSLHKNVK